MARVSVLSVALVLCLAIAVVVEATPALQVITNIVRDDRQCFTTPCGGYRVSPVNIQTFAPVYVARIESASGKDADENRVQKWLNSSAPGQLTLKGFTVTECYCETSSPCSTDTSTCQKTIQVFKVVQIYLGLPGVKPTSNTVYVVDETKDGLVATVLNTATTYRVSELSFAPIKKVGLTLLDYTWLQNRVLKRGAVVTGSISSSGVLAIDQEFIPIPDRDVPCRSGPSFFCIRGDRVVWRRTPFRCFVETGCVPDPICPLYIPACSPGYRLASWPSKKNNGCLEYRCDPAFVPPATIA
eukprot:jgi/Chlat1/3366/Chrsp23S03719